MTFLQGRRLRKARLITGTVCHRVVFRSIMRAPYRLTSSPLNASSSALRRARMGLLPPHPCDFDRAAAQQS